MGNKQSQTRSWFACFERLEEGIVVVGHLEYAQYHIVKWNQSKLQYEEIDKARFKKSGDTRRQAIRLIKRSKFKHHQIFFSAVRDICRVNFNLAKPHRIIGDDPHEIHPIDILFRGDQNVMDYEELNEVHIAVMFKTKFYIFD